MSVRPALKDDKLLSVLFIYLYVSFLSYGTDEECTMKSKDDVQLFKCSNFLRLETT